MKEPAKKHTGAGGKRPGAGRPRGSRTKRPAATHAPQGATPAQPGAIPVTHYPDAEAYLCAVVEGRETPDQLRIGAAKALLAYQKPKQRAPVPSPAPRELAKKAATAGAVDITDEFERKAATIRAKHSTKGKTK